MRRILSFWRARHGGAAIEFGLIAPFLVGALLLGFDGWRQVRHVSDMREAVEAGARYFQSGGADDTAAQRAALAGWPEAPEGGSVTVTRQCKCGEVVVACTSLCNATDPPMTYVTLDAQAPFRGFTSTRELSQRQVLRVR